MATQLCTKVILLRTLETFREAAEFLRDQELKDRERSDDSKPFLEHLDAYCLLLTECLSETQDVESKVDLETITHPILRKFTSCLESSFLIDYQREVPSTSQFRKLAAFNHYWSLSRPPNERYLELKFCLNFGSTERRDEMILLIRGCVSMLQSQQLNGSQTRRNRQEPQKNRHRPLPSVFIGALSVFEALVTSSIVCSPLHNHDFAARLRLSTHHQQSEDNSNFDAFISLNETCHIWQEIQIKNILFNTPPKKKRRTGFTSIKSNCGNKRALTPRRLAVERLCEQMEKIRSMPLMRLNLLVEDGKLWKSKSSRTEHQSGRQDSLLSLRDLIESRPTSITEKVKRVLAVFLAYSLLHLRGTPWLRSSNFKTSQILFFGTSTTIPLKPYIHTFHERTDYSSTQFNETNEGIDPDDLPLHTLPDIVMLAVILMEVYMVQSIDSLAGQVGMATTDWDYIDTNTRYSIAIAVFERFKADFTDNYRSAVDSCLDPNIGFDDDDQELSQEALYQFIYDEIVHPLEDELEQGFGNTVQIDNLDELALAMDLNRFGQPQRTRHHYSQSDAESRPVPKELDNINMIPVCYPRKFGTTLKPRWSENCPGRRHEDYTVGWICALPKELAAAEAMFDEHHPNLPQDPGDQNTYVLGRIGVHNVVMVCLPAGVTGTVSAARVADRMRSTFRWIRFGLMIGIGGGVPDVHDVRLGDVVVEEPSGCFGGVIQYDFGKTVQDQKFLRTGSLNRPPDVLLSAVARLKADHYRDPAKIERYIKQTFVKNPHLKEEFSYPGTAHDLLFHSDYDHASSDDGNNLLCQKCDRTKLLARKLRDSACPRIHYGLVASGNQVMRHGRTRARLARELGIVCFEMEAAGLVDSFPCLVIRGICDYSDSHKNKRWQGYAAVTAAAYAKDLLDAMSRSQGGEVENIVG